MLDGQVTPKLLQDQLSMIAQQQQLLQSLQHQQLQLQAAQQHHTQQMQLMQQGALHATSAPLSVGPQSSAAPQPAAGTANGSGPIISEQLATLALTQGGDPALKGDDASTVQDWAYLIMIFLAKHFKADRMRDHRGVSLLEVLLR